MADQDDFDDEEEIILSELNDDELTEQMHDDLYNGLNEEIVEGTNILLERGWGADRVLNDALVEGMRIVGIDFRDGILFVPEVLMAANAMKAGMAILRPLLAETGAESVGKVVIGTVKGDIHDIGKNLVGMMLEGAGFEVIDLGINNPVEDYLAALEDVETFDQAMGVPHLLEHFENFESREVLPALTLELPFSKADYLQKVIQRFGNAAIGDTVERICADGMVKFPIFIRPTLEGCFKQGVMPVYAIRSIASWYVFALHVDAGKIPFKYIEPGWKTLQEMLGTDAFLMSEQLWGTLPVDYPDFTKTLQREIVDMEQKWPV